MSSMTEQDRPRKKMKVLLGDETSEEKDNLSDNIGGVAVKQEAVSDSDHGFTVNVDFARRFEHNKKREELHRLQEKYGKGPAHIGEEYARRERRGDLDDVSGSSTDSEEEDDEGVLASEALDEQIHATLEAIRGKDPRVYDEKATFYTEDVGETLNGTNTYKSKVKPMYLSDYHRRNLLEGEAGTSESTEEPITYAQLQNSLKTTVVQEMHAVTSGIGLAATDDQSKRGEGDDDDDGFLVRKSSSLTDDTRRTRTKASKIQLNAETADKDPETFLSNFMSARAWVPSAGLNLQPFESDDEEQDQRAERFEEAYNLRFEDPKGSNEKLLSHARDAAAKYSVRREDINARKKARDAERAKKDVQKQKRDNEKARLRTLEIADAEKKIKKIQEAAGLSGNSLKEEDWIRFLDEGWDDDRWEQEMKKRFGDAYYAEHEPHTSNRDDGKGKHHLKKPKWTDEIDIKDLVPEFEAEDEMQKPPFTLTDYTAAVGSQDSISDGGSTGTTPMEHVVEDEIVRKRERDEQKKEARKEHRRIEQLVDEKLNADDTISGSGTRNVGHFRYRDTSPLAYGLTAHDILMASDSQLNQFAGLKKMATFRDTDKKRKDKKILGKKARLRQWRKETFGSEYGPQKTLAEVLACGPLMGKDSLASEDPEVNVKRALKRKIKSRKSKPQSTET